MQEEEPAPPEPKPAPAQSETPAGRRDGKPHPAETPPAPPAPAAASPWEGLLQVGMALLQQFTAPSGGAAGNGQAPAGGGMPARVCRDEQTGETYLRLPVPPAGVVQQAAAALQQLLASMRG